MLYLRNTWPHTRPGRTNARSYTHVHSIDKNKTIWMTYYAQMLPQRTLRCNWAFTEQLKKKIDDFSVVAKREVRWQSQQIVIPNHTSRTRSISRKSVEKTPHSIITMCTVYHMHLPGYRSIRRAATSACQFSLLSSLTWIQCSILSNIFISLAFRPIFALFRPVQFAFGWPAGGVW